METAVPMLDPGQRAELRGEPEKVAGQLSSAAARVVYGEPSGSGEIQMPPDVIEGPWVREIPGLWRFDRFGNPGSPADGWLDPGKLPGGGTGPDRQDPGTDNFTDWLDWHQLLSDA